MKRAVISLAFAAAALATALPAHAELGISIGIVPPVFIGYPPPVVYQPAPYYAPPPVVYVGGGHWGGDRGRHDRDHRERGKHR